MQSTPPNVRVANVQRHHLGLKTVVLLEFSELICRKAMRLEPLVKS